MASLFLIINSCNFESTTPNIEPNKAKLDNDFVDFMDSYIELVTLYSDKLKLFKEQEKVLKKDLDILETEGADIEIAKIFQTKTNPSIDELKKVDSKLKLFQERLLRIKQKKYTEHQIETMIGDYATQYLNYGYINETKLKEDKGNCRGIYEACLGAATLGGAACIFATAGAGIPACVVAAGAAMEYCRQQYIGCAMDHQE